MPLARPQAAAPAVAVPAVSSEFPWPALPGFPERPRWQGDAFEVGGRRLPILCYHATSSGWSDDLTRTHEAAAGERHPIDVASRREALRALAPVLAQRRPVVLDIGCSSGYMLNDLQAAAPHVQLIGADYLAAPLERLHERMPRVPLLQFDLVQCPLPDACIDGITLLNVLEHIEDDAGALRQLARILAPGGVLALEVPAGPQLFDFYDRALLHFRRYRLAPLVAALRGAGLQIVRRSHLGCLLYPFFARVKKANQRRELHMTDAERDAALRAEIRDSSHRLVGAAMRVELALGRLLSWPFGIRCLITARKEAAPGR